MEEETGTSSRRKKKWKRNLLKRAKVKGLVYLDYKKRILFYLFLKEHIVGKEAY